MRLIILALTTAVFAAQTAQSAHRFAIPHSAKELVLQAQADQSFKINQLEEEVRRLNGKVEELNFLLLQMQEKLRRMEEENELRFQEIEEGRSENSNGTGKVAKKADESGASDRLEKPEPSAGKKPVDGTKTPETGQVATRGLEPQALGTLTFDENGNVIDTGPGAGTPGVEDAAHEAAEYGDTPGAVFAKGAAAFERRDYSSARKILSAFGKAWPDDPLNGIALYQLGESRFWQKDFYEAANAHLEAHKKFPQVETAADNLLALGLALAGLNQRETACATYAEVLKQYPEAEKKLGSKVRTEQASAKC